VLIKLFSSSIFTSETSNFQKRLSREIIPVWVGHGVKIVVQLQRLSLCSVTVVRLCKFVKQDKRKRTDRRQQNRMKSSSMMSSIRRRNPRHMSSMTHHGIPLTVPGGDDSVVVLLMTPLAGVVCSITVIRKLSLKHQPPQIHFSALTSTAVIYGYSCKAYCARPG